MAAEDAEGGLRLARDHRPDLILMDIQLPNMNGHETTRVIKKNPDLKDIPVVALTSYAIKDDRGKALVRPLIIHRRVKSTVSPVR